MGLVSPSSSSATRSHTFYSDSSGQRSLPERVGSPATKLARIVLSGGVGRIKVYRATAANLAASPGDPTVDLIATLDNPSAGVNALADLTGLTLAADDSLFFVPTIMANGLIRSTLSLSYLVTP